jgi:hypothetical protein
MKNSLPHNSLASKDSQPKLKALNCLHLPIIRAVEIRLSRAYIRMPRQSPNFLDRSLYPKG